MEIERLARLEEQGKWIATKVDKMDNKLDQLITSHASLRVKVGVAASLFAFITTLIVEFIRR